MTVATQAQVISPKANAADCSNLKEQTPPKNTNSSVTLSKSPSSDVKNRIHTLKDATIDASKTQQQLQSNSKEVSHQTQEGGLSAGAENKSDRLKIEDELTKSLKLWEYYDDHEERIRCKAFGGRTSRLLSKAKRNHRTDISAKDWSAYGYYKRWIQIKDQLVKATLDNIPRIHGPNYTLERFQLEFEKTVTPCVITGLADKWLARKQWNLMRMRQEYGERLFKCGEDDDGYSIKVKLKHFLRYQNSSEPGGAKLDDSPLYIFDSHYDEDRINKQLLKEYEVPHLFAEDLFHLVGEKSRPPYRWILFGPARSGSCIHIDPLGTSAWNTLIRGHKLWVLFPPHLKKHALKGKQLMKKSEDDEAIDWFVNLLPRILEQEGDEFKQTMIQFIQKPGETVFVPSNWWHAVLNLDTTVAVTQNFCSSGNFDIVWRKTRTGRTTMAGRWLLALKEARSDLALRAQRLDELDGFSLDHAISEVIAKRERKKKMKEQKRLAREKAKESGMKVETSSDSSDSESSSSDDD